MAGPSFSSMHSCTVGSVSNRRAWPSMSWGQKHRENAFVCGLWRAECISKFGGTRKKLSYFILCFFLPLFWHCPSPFPKIQPGFSEVVQCLFTGSHLNPQLRKSFPGAEKRDHLKNPWRVHQRSDQSHFMPEELKQGADCRQTPGDSWMEKLMLVPLPSQTLSPPPLAHNLLSTGLCVPCTQVHQGPALFHCWMTKRGIWTTQSLCNLWCPRMVWAGKDLCRSCPSLKHNCTKLHEPVPWELLFALWS